MIAYATSAWLIENHLLQAAAAAKKATAKTAAAKKAPAKKAAAPAAKKDVSCPASLDAE